MKYFIVFHVMWITCSSMSFGQNVAINATGNPAATSAALDVDANNKGVLIPRVALTSTGLFAPVTGTPTVSLLVYNTATAGAGATAVTPGFYYWDGTNWIKIGNDATDWHLTGNSGTSAASNFIGTTDALDFVTRTNNAERMRVTSSGDVGIGIGNPVSQLEVAQSPRTGTHSPGNTFYVTGDLGQIYGGAEFMHTNGTHGVGLGWNGIYKTGSTTNSDLEVRSKGTGNILLETENQARLAVLGNGNINIDPMATPVFPRIGKALVWSGQDANSPLNFNSDPVAIYRYDSIADNTTLRIVVGDNAGSPTTGLGDRIQFGNSNPPNFFNPTITINSTGDLSIGRSHAISRLDVTGLKQSPANGGNGTSSDLATQAIITSINGISRANDWPNTWMGGISTWDICGASTYFSGYFTRSDSTLKKEIRNMDQDVFERFFQLRPVTYNLKSETPELNGKQYGFIAQEVGELFPTLVTTKQEESGTIGMNYQGLIAPTIYVVQQQQQEIKELKAQLERQQMLLDELMNDKKR